MRWQWVGSLGTSQVEAVWGILWSVRHAPRDAEEAVAVCERTKKVKSSKPRAAEESIVMEMSGKGRQRSDLHSKNRRCHDRKSSETVHGNSFCCPQKNGERTVCAVRNTLLPGISAVWFQAGAVAEKTDHASAFTRWMIDDWADQLYAGNALHGPRPRMRAASSPRERRPQSQGFWGRIRRVVWRQTLSTVC